MICGLLLNDGNKRQETPLIREAFIEEVILALSLKPGEILDGLAEEEGYRVMGAELRRQSMRQVIGGLLRTYFTIE